MTYGSAMLTSQAKRVLIADDHPLYRAALQTILPRACSGAHVAEAACQDEVMNQVASDSDFDLIVLDLNLPGATGLSCLQYVHHAAPLTPIIVVSGNDDPATMSEARLAGAAGYVPKSAPGDVLVQAIRLVMAGGTYLPAATALRHSMSLGPVPADPIGEPLTSRQLRVLRLLTQGLSNKQIARDLEISEITVKAHVSAIFRKLGVSNRTQAANAARRLLND